MSRVLQSLIPATAPNALPGANAEYRSAGSLSFATISDASHWAQLLEQADRAHSVQAFGYGEAKATKGWYVNRQLLSFAGRPVAIVQALEKRVLGKRVVTRINRGPMFLVAEPPEHLVLAVYRGVRNHWGRLPFGVLLMAPALENTAENKAILKKAGFRPRKGNGWGSARLDLARPIDAVFDGLDHRWRKAIRASVREGVVVQVADSEADHQWMIKRHLQNMAE